MAMIGKLRRRRFGEILVGDGLITQDQLDEALAIQNASGDTLGTILLDLGHIVETDIVKALSVQYQLPCIRPGNYDINRSLSEPFDSTFLHQHLMLPFDKIGPLMLVLLHDIPSKGVLEEVQAISGCDLAIYLGTSSDIKVALREIVPISTADEESIRASRMEQRGVARAAGAVEATPSIDTGELTLESMDLSSENLLSSLDAAWESIFVEDSDDDDGPTDDETQDDTQAEHETATE